MSADWQFHRVGCTHISVPQAQSWAFMVDSLLWESKNSPLQDHWTRAPHLSTDWYCHIIGFLLFMPHLTKAIYSPAAGEKWMYGEIELSDVGDDELLIEIVAGGGCFAAMHGKPCRSY